MRVTIIGTGAMGSLFAARLADLCRLVMLGSWQAQLDAVETQGLTLIDLDGARRTTHFPVSRSTAHLRNMDLALVLVKSWQTERAARQARRLLSADGIALTLQNGLGNDQLLAAVVGSDRVACGVTSEGANMVGPGEVRYAGRGVTYLTGPAVLSERLTAVMALLRQADFIVHLKDDPTALVWGKLAVNAGINPLTALLMVPNGYLPEHEPARTLMIGAAEETAAVAAAMGITLPYPSAGERALEVARATAANRSSMLQDIARGAPTEVEAITGAIVRHGREVGVATPVNEALLLLVRAMLADGDWSGRVSGLAGEVGHLFKQVAAARNSV